MNGSKQRMNKLISFSLSVFIFFLFTKLLDILVEILHIKYNNYYGRKLIKFSSI